jgi:hypothetical protein
MFLIHRFWAGGLQHIDLFHLSERISFQQSHKHHRGLAVRQRHGRVWVLGVCFDTGMGWLVCWRLSLSAVRKGCPSRQRPVRVWLLW